MRQGKIILPKDWMAWDEILLDSLNQEFDILEITQSLDGHTYTALGRSSQFRETNDYPLYLILLNEKNQITFKEFKDEDYGLE